MPLRTIPPPKTGGILTFSGAPRGTIEDLQPGMVGVFGVPFDLSSSAKIGARFGPRAFREASTYYYPHTAVGGGVFEVDTKERVNADLARPKIRDLGDVSVVHTDWAETSSRISERISRIVLKGASPVAMGGDHLITLPLLQGYKDALIRQGAKRIGYIQFSSRLDLGDKDPLWGDVWGGSTARQIIDSGIVSPENIVWIGINRYVRSEEWRAAQKLGAKIFTTEDVRRMGIHEVTARAMEIAGKGCDSTYVSTDLSVVDGALLAGTDTPRFDGLRNVDLWIAMDMLTRDKAGAMDMCGLNPLAEIVGLGETGQRFGVHLALKFIHPKIGSIEVRP